MQPKLLQIIEVLEASSAVDLALGDIRKLPMSDAAGEGSSRSGYALLPPLAGWQHKEMNGWINNYEQRATFFYGRCVFL